MLKLVVLVSGGGTNLQAIIDGIADGSIPNTEIKAVISNNKNAYALQRAKDHNIAAACVSPKDFADRAAFNQALLEKIKSYEPDLIVLAGCLVVIPEIMVDAYPNKIINIHPSLIPAFCGTGYYGLKVHEGVLKRGVKVTGATVHFVDKGTLWLANYLEMPFANHCVPVKVYFNGICKGQYMLTEKTGIGSADALLT